MAELRFFKGTRQQYDAVANKHADDFYVTTEVRESDGQTYYALWIGEHLIAHAQTPVELSEKIAANANAIAAEKARAEAAEKSLQEAIQQTTQDAKSYSIVAITEGLDANVREAFKLVDEDGTQAGDVINIYKDSALESVDFDGEAQELVFVYRLADGSEKTVRVNVSAFLTDEEYADGLQVIDHIVSVKRDATSEDFLSISKDGIKISGVQKAIDDAVTSEKEAREAADSEIVKSLEAEVERAEAAEKSLQEALEAEKARAEKAEKALEAALEAEAKAREAADAAEKARAEAAELALQNAIDAEQVRAEGVEDALNESIKIESEIREAADDVLRRDAVVSVKPVEGSAVHVTTRRSLSGQDVMIGMRWMSIANDLSSEAGIAAFLADGGDGMIGMDMSIDSTLNIEKNSHLDLNGYVVTNQVNNANTDVLVVKADAELVIEGDGGVVAVSGNDGYPVIADGIVKIYGGRFESGADANGATNACIYARGNGKVYIYGGEFHSADGAFVLNKKDGDRNTCEIHVMGGRFYNFNPANNASEGPNTNFVEDGYVSIEVEPNVWEVMHE